MLDICIAFMIGTLFGVVTICCCVMAGREDRGFEGLERDNDIYER